MAFIFESQSIGGLSFSIWENDLGQFVAVVTDPDCSWQSEPVETIAQAEALARQAIMNELLNTSQIIMDIASEVFSA